jgi:hypothetical protein
VANVDLRTCRARFVIALDCVCYTILSQIHDGSVIVIYELGASRISRSGALLWNRTTDVVVDFADGDQVLRLRTEGGEITVEKYRGAFSSSVRPNPNR